MDGSAMQGDEFSIDHEAIVTALERPFATIDFSPDGTILRANGNFVACMGYADSSEIVGRHHRIFMFAEDSETPEYVEFWRTLGRGHFHQGEFKRKNKKGEPVWIIANYVPIPGPDGAVRTIRKYAVDVTARKVAVNALIQSLNCLSTGDVTTRVNLSDMDDDFEVVGREFNEMMSGLETRMSNVIGAADSFGKTSNSMMASATTLSQQAEAQAISLRQTSDTVADIAKRSTDNSNAAADAALMSQDTAKRAKEGETVVKQTIEAMAGIEKFTGEVADISRIIGSFAFQTNLLSINAAVEAARAGEAGKGFAVVASEVRQLAQRSAEASRNIARLTQESGDEVAKGVTLAKSAGEALTTIERAATEVAEAVGTIANASKEQTASVAEVATTLGELRDGVNDVATLADKGREHANALQSNMHVFEDLMDHFTTRNDPPPR